MKTKLSIFLLIAAIPFFYHRAFAQVDHWETVIEASDTWRYRYGTSEPDTNWRKVSFSDGSWNTGPGGFGYGDGDDGTTIPSWVSTVYMRRTFTVTDTSDIYVALLHIDYDDGFVAYINNVEVARSNVGNVVGDHPGYLTSANSSHEAHVYAGEVIENFFISGPKLKACLVNGTNVLAIQVHNRLTSSDMTSNAWLSFGMKTPGTTYGPTPSWFYPVPVASDLPIVQMQTGPFLIVDDPRIAGTMGIVNHGPGIRNYLFDAFDDYSGPIEIEIRGSSSQSFPKKSYGFETKGYSGLDSSVKVIGMPKENDWILYAPYTDKTYLRDVMAFDFFRKMDHYNPRIRFCEVFHNNQYLGLYVMTERIKIDNDRVDLPELDADDNAGDSITGGYVVKVDKPTGSGTIAFTSITDPKVAFLYHDPEDVDLTPAQASWFESLIGDFETAHLGSNFAHPTLGYRKYLDAGSFVDYQIIQELAHNVDGYRLSYFMHKNRDSNGGFLRAGPVWDCNLCFGNSDYCEGERTDTWVYNFNSICPTAYNLVPFWWGRFFDDTRYQSEIRCRWDFLRQSVLHTDTVFAWIDSMATLLAESESFDHQRWPILGVYVWPNNYVGATYADEIAYLKLWYASRVGWLDANLPSPLPVCTSAGFENVFITEINYNSDIASDCGDWFELYNNGTSAVDLTGWRIKDENPANIYQFPPGTVILPDSYLVVCQDTALFAAVHPAVSNFTGSFNFSLGNGSDEIHLFDAGYTQVFTLRYSDSLPWPTGPDGGSYTLEIVDPFGDLSDAANWFEGCPLGSPGKAYFTPCFPTSITSGAEEGITLWPNPATDEVYLRISETNWQSGVIQLADMSGKVHLRKSVAVTGKQSLDVSALPAGMYIVTFENSGGTQFSLRLSIL